MGTVDQVDERRAATVQWAAAGEGALPEDAAERVQSLLATAQGAGGGERRRAADALNALFAALPRDGGRPAADLLQGALGDPRLEGLVDSEGTSCRAKAAEALLGLGYPYALELSPEDLDHLRQGSGPRTPRAAAVGGAVLVGATSALQLAQAAAGGWAEPVVAGHGVLAALSATLVALSRPPARPPG